MIKLARRLSIQEVIKSSGFRKSEAGLLEKAVDVFSRLERMGVDKQCMSIGGFATRLYVNSSYTGRFSSGEPTDLDVTFDAIPYKIKKHFKEDSLIDVVRTVMSSTLKRIEVLSEFKVYHLREEERKGEMGFLDDMCLFNGYVGPIVVRQEDLQLARLLDVFFLRGDKRIDGTLRVADPGFVIATAINPAAITQTRAWRVLLVLASMKEEEFKEAVERYVDVIKASGIEIAALATPMQVLKQKGTTKSYTFGDQVMEFISQVEKRIGKTLSA